MQSYQNPVLRGMYPDPSITRVDNTFYLANSTFEYYPGISISKSKDLINWTAIDSVAKIPEQADLRKAHSNEGIFAACIRYHDGRFYVITTNFAEFKSFIISGVFSKNHETIIWDTKRVEVPIMGIDPDLYFEDNHAYVQYTGFIDKKENKAIHQVEINLKTGRIIAGPKVLSKGTGGRDVEGPHIIKKSGRYYLLMAEGGTGQGHMITIMSSSNLWGPYSDEPGINPLFTNRDRANEPLQNIGHADLFKDNLGNWWLTCLGTRPANIGFKQITNIGRETLLYPVKWNQKWPKVYKGVPSQTVNLKEFSNHAKLLANSKQCSYYFKDTFSDKELNHNWLSLRDSLKDKLQIKNNRLYLLGSNINLDEEKTPCFIGLRQAEHSEKMVAQIDTQLTQLKHGKISLAVIINRDHWVEMTIKKESDNKFSVSRFQKVGDVQINKLIGYLSELPERFELICTPSEKQFVAINGNEKVSFNVEALNLSNEAIAALNTGDIQGFHLSGDVKLVLSEVEAKALKDKEDE